MRFSAWEFILPQKIILIDKTFHFMQIQGLSYWIYFKLSTYSSQPGFIIFGFLERFSRPTVFLVNVAEQRTTCMIHWLILALLCYHLQNIITSIIFPKQSGNKAHNNQKYLAFSCSKRYSFRSVDKNIYAADFFHG